MPTEGTISTETPRSTTWRAFRRLAVVAMGAAFLAGPPFVVYLASGGMQELPPSAAARYAARPPVKNCTAICATAPEKGTDRLDIDGVPPVSVRVPTNYDREQRHPLLVVFAPAGMNRFQSESYYALTTAATARGFVVAYSSAGPLSKATFAAQAQVADAVAQQWCVDLDRVAFVGHSDGASTAYGIALLEHQAVQPKAMFLSGAGIDGKDLSDYACPATRSVIVSHGRRDTHFQGFGREASSWWSKCFHCEGNRSRQVASNCTEALGCMQGARLVFCEPDAQHEDAPKVDEFDLDFIEQALNDQGGK